MFLLVSSLPVIFHGFQRESKNRRFYSSFLTWKLDRDPRVYLLSVLSGSFKNGNQNMWLSNMFLVFILESKFQTVENRFIGPIWNGPSSPSHGFYHPFAFQQYWVIYVSDNVYEISVLAVLCTYCFCREFFSHLLINELLLIL